MPEIPSSADRAVRALADAVGDSRPRLPSDGTDPAIPVAATVVIVRDGSAGPEVLMIERPDRGSFAGAWVFPGGKLDPADAGDEDETEEQVARRAGVRETWEETGLHVELTRLLGVFGGALYRARYSNGDEIAFVSTVFLARPLRGTLKPDGEETLETRYFAQAELASLPMKPHVPPVLAIAFSGAPHAHFEPSTWTP